MTKTTNHASAIDDATEEKKTKDKRKIKSGSRDEKKKEKIDKITKINETK